MAELVAALDEAEAGRGRMVMLVGEPGIGKTRTAEELETISLERGAEVIWGRCPEERGAPSYWPWMQVFRSYIAARDADTIRDEMGVSAPIIAETVVELQEILPDIPAPPSISDLDGARFRLFDAISAFFKRVAQNKTLVLMLDNLHWSDEVSLRLLEFIAQDLASTRLLIVGTYRDVDVSRGHPLYRALGDLTRQRLFSRIQLRGLEEEQTARLISGEMATTAPKTLVENVHAQTEGNPLFVGEIVRLLASEGRLNAGPNTESAQWEARLPDGIREAIGRRLDRLTGTANEVLTIAAVIGRQFELRQLVEIDDDHTENELLDVLEEAMESRVVEELPGPPGRFEFTHALIQGTLAGELSATRTVRMHARVASALERLHGEDAEVHAEELLGHFVQAETVLGADPVIRYAAIAGRHALDSFDPALAAQYFSSGIEALGDGAEDERLANLLWGLGRAQNSTLERTELQTAIDNLTRAFDIYLSIEQPDIAIQVAMTPMLSVHGPSGRADLLERALNLVEDGTGEQARLLAEFGLWASHERADYERAKDAFSQAMAYAESTSDDWLKLRIHTNATPVHAWNLNSQESDRTAKSAIQLVEKLDAPTFAVQPHFHQGHFEIDRGDLDAARRHAKASELSASRTGNVFDWTSAMNLKAVIALTVGDWDTARDSLEQGLVLSPTEHRLRFPYAAMEFSLGEFESAIAQIDAILSEGLVPGAMRADTLYLIGALTGAPVTIPQSLIDGARKALYAEDVEPMSRGAALQSVIRAAILRHDRDLAKEVYDHPLFEKDYADISAPFVRPLSARIEWIAEFYEQAESRYEATLEFFSKAGYRPLWVGTAESYAKSLIERGSQADMSKAANLVDEALPIAQELGMKPSIAKLETLREQVGTVSGEYPDGLSEREVDVLRLIAAGHSNQKIADELFLSRYTIVRHVSNIFGKTGAANRAEAAIYAERQGLTKN